MEALARAPILNHRDRSSSFQIALGPAVPYRVQRDAMEAAAEYSRMTQPARHDYDAVGFQETHQVRLVTIDHGHLRINHQEIHPHPGRAQSQWKDRRHRLLDWRTPYHVPTAQRLWYGFRPDAFGVEQNKARAQEADCAVDVRSLVDTAQRMDANIPKQSQS
jgi:hypothetical protein